MSQSALSVTELEAQIETARRRLAATLDELTVRGHPKTLLRERLEAARASAVGQFWQDGQPRLDRVAAAVGVVAFVVALSAVGRRRRRR